MSLYRHGSIILLISSNPSVTDNDITLLDILYKNINKFLSESVQISETVKKDIVKNINDTIQFTENISIKYSITKLVSDLVKFDDLALKATHLLIDDAVFNENIQKAITKVISIADNMTINEFSGKNKPINISDSLSTTDLIVKTVYRAFVQSVVDTLLVGDITSRQIGKYIQETPGMIDNISKGINKMILDGITPVEILVKNLGSLLLEQTRTIRPKGSTNIEAEGTLVNR